MTVRSRSGAGAGLVRAAPGGLAYGFQQLEHIAAAAHDVRMDAVVTEEGSSYALLAE